MNVTIEPEDDTAALVRQAQAGDRAAFDLLVERHRERLAAAVERRLGRHLRGRIEVEDVLQETFLKALRSLDTFEDRGPDSFLRWLRAISENLLLYWAREHQRKEQIPLPGEVRASGASPSRSMRREERFERLEHVLSRLNPIEREVILLARVEGTPLKEVARRLERSHDAVRQILWRALRKLRTSFGDTESLSLPGDAMLGESGGRSEGGGDG